MSLFEDIKNNFLVVGGRFQEAIGATGATLQERTGGLFKAIADTGYQTIGTILEKGPLVRSLAGIKEPLPTTQKEAVRIAQQIGLEAGGGFVGGLESKGIQSLLKEAKAASSVEDFLDLSRKFNKGQLLKDLKDFEGTIGEKLQSFYNQVTKKEIPIIQPLAQEARKFPTIHQGGKIKMVEGTPVKIIDGVDTFLHKGDGGWIVSEASTGRFIAESRSADGAIAKAHFNIDNVGKDKFLKLLEENKLTVGVSEKIKLTEPQLTIKPVRTIANEAKEARQLEWAKGTRAAGIQNAGLKNYNEATRVLENSGELPKAIKTEKVTKDFIKDYYTNKKSPVVGDTFTNAKGEVVEITKVEDNSVSYFLKGKKKGIAGNVYADTAFKTKSQLTDFYNQAVKEIATEPQLKVGVSRGIANEAIDFAKANPDSSLVAKEFRNPITKELESGPLLFRRIGESIRNGELSLDKLPEIVSKYGLSAEDTARLFEDAATYSGRTLQSLSRVEKELRALLPDIVFPERIPTLWEKFKSGYLAVDNFRRGLLVTQLATAARNAISQTGRYTLGTITDGMNGVIGKITGQAESFTPFFEDIAAVLRKFEKGNIQKLQNVLRKNPIENARLYNTPVGDVALSGKITNVLNAFNRGQEYFFRNLILDAKLNAAAKINKVPIEKLGMAEIERAVSEALEWTYSKSPIRGSFGDAIMKTYRAMPPLTLVNPFPRFMANAVKFLYEYSPAGIMSLFGQKTRAAIAAGDYNAISKAVIGTSMLGAAVAIRANDNLAGEKWYEIKWGDKTIDMRPFAPFSTYLLFGELMTRGGERISGSDWAQAVIGINRVAGTGLALVDLIGGKVDAKDVKNIVNGIVSAYIGGFTVPFVTIKDIIGNFRLEERTIKETKELPIIGGAVGNIPFLNETLPTKYSMFEDKPLQREQSLLRQLTGITFKTKSFIEKELDRMGKDIGDLIPKTGNLEANRIISKQTGVILDQFNEKLQMSEKYKTLNDEEKIDFLKNLVSEAKKEAKGEIASDLAGVVYNEIKKTKEEGRKKVIEDLKNRGLMTENILDYLLPMIEAQPLP